MLDKRWSKIMQEVDRLYWLNQTSEGRIACITDYIICLLIVQQPTPADETYRCTGTLVSDGAGNVFSVTTLDGAMKQDEAER